MKYYVGVHLDFPMLLTYVPNIYELIAFDLHVLENKQLEQVPSCQSACTPTLFLKIVFFELTDRSSSTFS